MSRGQVTQKNAAEVKATIDSGLYESEDFIKNIVNDSEDAIIAKDLTGIVKLWNKGAEKIFGYTAQEMIGGDMSRLIPNDLLYEEEVFLKSITNGQAIEHFETRRINKDGHLLHVSVTLSPIKNERGVVIGISKIARDTSKQFELLDSLRLTKNVIENSNDAIITKDLNGTITGWNKGAEKIFGYTAQEVIGGSMLRLFPPHRE